MQRRHVKTIILYYSRIPGMLKLLRQEQETLKTKPSNEGRSQEVAIKIQVLESDAEAIQSCIDLLNGKYKRIIRMRYLNKYSWAGVSIRTETSESTVRNWHDRAMDRLREALEEMPMADEILGRASRARD